MEEGGKPLPARQALHAGQLRPRGVLPSPLALTLPFPPSSTPFLCVVHLWLLTLPYSACTPCWIGSTGPHWGPCLCSRAALQFPRFWCDCCGVEPSPPAPSKAASIRKHGLSPRATALSLTFGKPRTLVRGPGCPLLPSPDS